MAKVKKQCNICGNLDYLTKDHVPPQCCDNRGNVNFYRLFDQNINPKKNLDNFKEVCVLSDRLFLLAKT